MNMKITIGWLREFLKTSLTYKEIINHLHNLGFETKKVCAHSSFWSKIEIVKIIEKIKHPDADTLNLYSIEKTDGTIIKIVCGDLSLEVGDFVPYAIPGVTMPSGLALQSRKIRGIESPGMLCSASELNFSAKCNGVLKCFSEDWGKKISEAYEAEAVFEIELTPNRGDALSILGIARILAQANCGSLNYDPLNTSQFSTPTQEFFEIKTTKCKGLLCSLFQHTIQPTPAKIAKRLLLTDHSILNLDVVDLTNYISHAIGQPIHVFDYDKIKKELGSIELLESNQEFETLAEQKITLEKGTLVFKVDNKIISWPSVIGGNNSKVEKNSTNILLETGVFIPDSMQRRKHGIMTLAAKRTEYGINPFSLKDATNIFFNLLNKKPTLQQYMPFTETKKLSFNFSKVKEILGSDINFDEFKLIMQKKDFIFNEDGTITPPKYKFFDIATENCIVEEFAIGRYQEIESINLSPKYPIQSKPNYSLDKLALSCGFNECKNISIDKKEHKDFQIDLKNRQIFNFSNQNYSVLRGSLIPNLLRTMAWHIHNQQKTYKFFEYGLIYGNFFNKQTYIFTALSNNYEDLQNLWAKILSDKQIENQIESRQEEISYANNSSSFFINNSKIASISSIKNSILKDFSIKECFALEIFPRSFNEAHSYSTTKSSDLLPIYQDITFKLPPNTSSSLITNFLNRKKLNYKLLNIFPNNDLNQERSLTVQFKIEQKKTLTRDQINSIMTNISNEILTIL